MGKRASIWLIFILLLVGPAAFATHIVGGEFELKHLQGNRYQLRLILYNDDLHGDEGAIDPEAVVYVWRKWDNSMIASYTLDYISREAITYNVPDCPDQVIRTSKVLYSKEIELDDEMFDDAGGYYISYERCCRNNIIDNIVRPESTGQTFYMEFSTIDRARNPIINSSPVLPSPPTSYLPVGVPVKIALQATDPDGDQLVYRLAEPLKGYSSPEEPLPTPRAAPYPTVSWQSGFGVNNMVPGSPALHISEEGFLEVTPSREGLFVYAVVVEEYRNGVKLGEVRREYQVVTYKQNNSAPEVLTSLNNFEPNPTQTLEVPLGEPIRFRVRVTDEEQNELVLTAAGEGFRLQDLGMSFTSGPPSAGMVEGEFFWNPSCAQIAALDSTAFTLVFTGEDEDVCDANDVDVVRVNIEIVVPENNAPALSAYQEAVPVQAPLSVEVGQSLAVLLEGIDLDVENNLQLVLDSVAGAAGTFYYDWQNASGQGTVASLLTIAPSCELLGGQSEALLTFYFHLSDDYCIEAAKDTLAVEVLVYEQEQDFSPVKYINVFTPNGDDCNPWFEIKNLPEDVCNNKFEFVRVYNRWGKLLFESTQRDFRWNGDGLAAGVYYYLLKYTNQTYRSPLTVILGEPVNCIN